MHNSNPLSNSGAKERNPSMLGNIGGMNMNNMNNGLGNINGGPLGGMNNLSSSLSNYDFIKSMVLEEMKK